MEVQKGFVLPAETCAAQVLVRPAVVGELLLEVVVQEGALVLCRAAAKAALQVLGKVLDLRAGAHLVGVTLRSFLRRWPALEVFLGALDDLLDVDGPLAGLLLVCETGKAGVDPRSSRGNGRLALRSAGSLCANRCLLHLCVRISLPS